MSPEETWVSCLASPETPLTIAGDATPIGTKTENASPIAESASENKPSEAETASFTQSPIPPTTP